MKKAMKIPAVYRTRVRLFSFDSGMNGGIDDKIAPPSLAKISLNFDMSDGSLKDGLAIIQYAMTSGKGIARILAEKDIIPQKCFYFKCYDPIKGRSDDRIMIYATNKKMYEWRTAFVKETLDSMQSSIFIALNTTYDLNFPECPNAVCYKFNGDDVIIFSTQSIMKIYNGKSVINVEGVPDITSMCIHSERLFVTTGGEETSLWFSDDFNPTDWYISLDQAGFIDFQDGKGRLLKTISFNNYVYIFRNYGISRLSAYGEQREFYTTNLITASGRIYKNAIIECGNRIIYLSEDGFYSFDGLSSTRILTGYDKYLKGVDNSSATGKFYNGCIYVALNMKIDGYDDRVLLVYNLHSATSYIAKGINVCDIEVIAANNYSSLAILIENESKVGMLSSGSALFNQPFEKHWESNFSDFDIDGEKILTKITLFTLTEIELTIKSNLTTRTFKLSGSESRQTVNTGIRGNTFSVGIMCNQTGSSISKVIAYFNHF